MSGIVLKNLKVKGREEISGVRKFREGFRKKKKCILVVEKTIIEKRILRIFIRKIIKKICEIYQKLIRF